MRLRLSTHKCVCCLLQPTKLLKDPVFVPDRTFSTRSERVGTFYGQAADDYREVNQGQEVGTYYIPGGCRAFRPGRLNYFFKFAGPSYSVDTACSSGLAAIELACQSLWSGEVDKAVASGVNILTNPDGFAGLGKGSLPNERTQRLQNMGCHCGRLLSC